MTTFEYSFGIFDDAHDPKYGEPWKLPLKIANAENIASYGRLVEDYEKEECWLRDWPVSGRRQLTPGTGKQDPAAKGLIRYTWKGDLLQGRNEASSQYGPNLVCRLPKGVKPENKTHALIREFAYHPDSGQVFYPNNKSPFVAILAPPGDDVELEDFVAFYFDGSCGFQVKPDVWHQAFPLANDNPTFSDKQGKLHACVMLDTVKEYNKFLSVPLKPEFAEK